MALITADETRQLATVPAMSESALPSKEVSIGDLFVIAGKICEASDGRVQLVRNENDADTSPVPDAAEFLKLDGLRLGRDLRLYNLIGRIGGDEQLVMHLLEEVAMPLRQAIPGAYEAIKPDLTTLGERVFKPDMHAQWRDVLA